MCTLEGLVLIPCTVDTDCKFYALWCVPVKLKNVKDASRHLDVQTTCFCFIHLVSGL